MRLSSFRQVVAPSLLAFSRLSGLPRVVRFAVLRGCGIQTESLNIRAGCYFGSTRVAIGRSTLINRGCFFDALAPIRIGERCALGMETMIVTSTHSISGQPRRAGPLESHPVTIGDGCWIGARAIILPGVTIGDGSVIAAGSVVVSDCEGDTLFAGVPAQAVRKL